MKDKIIIAIDAMGGENSPDKNIHGLSLFLQNNKADLFLKGKTNLQNRVNMMFYICSINNIKGKIFPKEFAHIVYNNKQYL